MGISVTILGGDDDPSDATTRTVARPYSGSEKEPKNSGVRFLNNLDRV